MMPSQISYNLNGPPDPRKHERYLNAVKQIKKIDPNRLLPDERDILACEKAEQILASLAEPLAPISARQREINADSAFYSEVVALVGREKANRIIPMDDIGEMPPLRGATDETFAELRRIKSIVLQRVNYFGTTTPREREMDQKIAQMGARIAELEGWKHDVEQELSRL
jgi:hypothetical protein